MFALSARYYDAIYAFKDYAGEAAAVDRHVQRLAPGSKTLLDVACGTGAHLVHLTARYTCEGLDNSAAQLEVAAARLPGIPLHEADMTEFDLGRRFDAVVCLFSSIGYAWPIERMRQSVERMTAHLEPGGVLLIEPWFGPDAWEDGHLGSLFVEEPELRIARMGIAGRRDDVAVLDMEHLVGTPRGIEHFVEHHELGLYTQPQYRQALVDAGLEQVHHDTEGLTGRGLHLAVKPIA